MIAERTYGGFIFTFPEAMVTVMMDRIVKNKRAIYARLDVRTTAPGYNPVLLQNMVTNLISLPAKVTLIKELAKRFNQAEWTGTIEQVYAHAIRVIEEGEPVLTIDPARAADGAAVPSLTWRVSPLVLDLQPTVLFGEKGTMKSYLAELVGLVVESGMSFSGLTGLAGKVLIVDYESEYAEFQRRAHLLAARHPELVTGCPLYYRGTIPFPDDIDKIAKLVAEHDVKLLIIDSLAMACGGVDLFSGETATRFFQVIRMLKVASLTVAHPQKNSEEKTIYGTVFFTNLARSVWQVKRVETSPGASVTRIGCFHEDANNTGRLHPIGFAFTFADDGITIEPHNVFADHGLVHAQTVPARIRHLLTAGKRTAQEIADEINAPLAQVKVRLSEGNGSWCVKLGNGLWGLKS